MDERSLTVTYSEDGEPPASWWEKIAEAWSKMTMFQRVALILGSVGGVVGVIGLTRGEKEEIE